MPGWLAVMAAGGFYLFAVWIFIQFGDRHRNPAPLLEKTAASLLFVVLGVASAWCGPAQGDGVYRLCLLVGLCFCCVGDMWLELHGKASFLAGLGTFLLGHVWYLVAFTHVTGFQWMDILSYALLLAVILLIQRRLPFRFGQMKIPALCYLVVITAMVVKAWSLLGAPAVSLGGAVLCAVGATLFFLSDGILACNLFLERRPIFRTLNLTAYYLGQGLLACSLGLIAS